MRRRWSTLEWIAVALAAVVLPNGLAGGGRALGEPLGSAETIAYEQWLHSVEQSAGAITGSDAATQHPLYPFAEPSPQGGAHQPYRHLAIGRALHQMEEPARQQDLQAASNAFSALNLARSYRHLGEYEKSLRWYDQAAQWDSAEVYTGDIGRESLAAAVALGDSLEAMRVLVNTLGAGDITVRESEYVLAYRYLLGKQDTTTLPLLQQKVNRKQQDIGPVLRFWHAFALAGQGNADAALAQLHRLLRGGGLSQDLSLEQRAWVLTTIPDLLLMQGFAQEAKSLYVRLAASSVTELRTWGTLQLANLDLASGRYGQAWRSYDLLCHSEETGPWQQAACDMASQAERLYRVKTEGEPHGVAAMHER